VLRDSLKRTAIPAHHSNTPTLHHSAFPYD
jgi:hypothetical protein